MDYQMISLKVLATRDSDFPCQYSFDELDQSLNHIGLAENVKVSVYKVLAALLHLCNLEFVDDLCQNAKISNDEPSNVAARLLKIDCGELKHALVNRQIKTCAENTSIL